METIKINVGGKEISIETGRIAKQANGSVMVTCGETVVFVSVCGAAEAREGMDFFPLTVDYREKTYAAGRIPGGFFKREARPTEEEILVMRLTDRPLRPMFPEGYHNEVQIMSQVLSYDGEETPDVLSMLGASAALAISDLPLQEPLGSIRVGYVDGQFVANPTKSQMEESSLNLVMAATEDAIMMVEGGSSEVEEEFLLEALKFGHDAIKPMVQAQNELVARCGKPKMAVVADEVNAELFAKVEAAFNPIVDASFEATDKKERSDALSAGKKSVLAELITEDNADQEGEVKEMLYTIQKKRTRSLMHSKQKRLDGRSFDEIRHIACEVGVLPRTHGSALFTRGETQALVTITLGSVDDQQMVDSLDGMSKKNFLLHYNFPPFSVGECKPVRGVSRREIGHGHLAQRALEEVKPDKEAFPYTIRVVSEIMESNGSSSMASVCGGSLAMMDAGVPIESMVSGIAMGLIKDGEQVIVLSDILGDEDHLGDMDFKVCGTPKGITAFQMDIKIKGISFEIMKTALLQAKEGRTHIAGKMNETITTHRKELSEYAPKLVTVKVPVDKIKDVIGSGGKVIKGIIEKTGVTMNVSDDGTVVIGSVDAEALSEAKSIVEGIVEEPEIGKIYHAKVVKIMDFGAFVEFLPGKEGLVHISQIADRRIEKVDEVLSEGDAVKVKLIDIDKMGRKSLSIKEATTSES